MRKKRRQNSAVRNIFLFTLVAMLIIAADVFFVAIGQKHVLSGTDLAAYVDSANTRTETEQALRGNIFDRNGNVIAQDTRTYNIICVLSEKRIANKGEIKYVKDKEGTAKALSSILHIDEEKILSYLNQDVYQTELGEGGRNLSKNTRDEIEELNLPGIEFTNSIRRVYPYNTFASNLIGYAQSDENGTTVGRMGLELYLDTYLKGTDGSSTYQVDKNGYILPGMKEMRVSAVNGDNVYLTLDSAIQMQLEDSFKITEEQFQADRIWGGAMEINTGKVIAWGQYPSYDPNTLENITDYNNIGAQMPYEPGSTLKSFAWAAAINEGKYNSSDTTNGNEFCYTSDANNNPVRTYGDSYGCIYNANRKQWGESDLDHGLVYSLNTVAAALQTEYITPDIHLDYLKKFGFFSKVDTDGLPEQNGILNFTWPADKLSLSYGQGSTVTMLQLFQAYSSIFSDGTMVKPYFVESIRDPYDNSNVIYQADTTVVGNPITEETAEKVQSILYHAVNDDDGSAKYYQIPECKLIGKTGTTQVASTSGGGNNAYESSGKTIVSLMCALPAENPQVLAYYAFEANYDRLGHFYTEGMTSFLRKIAQTYGFYEKAEETASEPVEEPVVTEEIEMSKMPSLKNHTLTYAQQQLEGTGVETVVLGLGNNVIDQYPKTSEVITTGQRVFLLTDSASFTMPDLTGWTRKDIMALWSVTGFAFDIGGEGKVVSQSVPAGTIVSKGTKITVTLSS